MKLEFDIQEKYQQLKIIIQNHTLNDEVQTVMDQLKNQKKVESLFGYEEDKIYVLKASDIYLFYSEQSKVVASLESVTYKMKDKLYQLEERLMNDGFVRISKSAIVNLNHIANIEATFDGGLVVVLNNNQKEVISRRYVKKVKEAIGIN